MPTSMMWKQVVILFVQCESYFVSTFKPIHVKRVVDDDNHHVNGHWRVYFMFISAL